MRIAMVQDDWWPEIGGGPQHVKNLSINLAEYFGHEIDIYTRALRKEGESFNEKETYVNGAVRVYRIGPALNYWNPIGRGLFLFLPLYHLFQRDYDIIHGHTFLPAFPTKLAGGLTDTSIVFTVHGTALTSGVGRDTSIGGWIKRRIERQFVLHFDYDHVISVNNEHLDLLKPYHRSVSVIPNGVNIDRFELETTKADEILFLGRLAPKKRVSDLITAFAEISDRFPTYELVIVGDGPCSKSLKSQAQEENIFNRVSFEGKVSNELISHFYNRAKLFVLPSVWEGHPLTLLEAWASKMPVVATDVEGIAEFIDHNETGYLVSPQSPSQLATAIEYALTNPEDAAKWGEAGYELVRTHHSWQKVAEKTDNLYRSIGD